MGGVWNIPQFGHSVDSCTPILDHFYQLIQKWGTQIYSTAKLWHFGDPSHKRGFLRSMCVCACACVFLCFCVHVCDNKCSQIRRLSCRETSFCLCLCPCACVCVCACVRVCVCVSMCVWRRDHNTRPFEHKNEFSKCLQWSHLKILSHLDAGLCRAPPTGSQCVVVSVCTAPPTDSQSHTQLVVSHTQLVFCHTHVYTPLGSQSHMCVHTNWLSVTHIGTPTGSQSHACVHTNW